MFHMTVFFHITTLFEKEKNCRSAPNFIRAQADWCSAQSFTSRSESASWQYRAQPFAFIFKIMNYNRLCKQPLLWFQNGGARASTALSSLGKNFVLFRPVWGHTLAIKVISRRIE